MKCDADAIKLIQDTAVKAERPHWIHPPGEPDDVYFCKREENGPYERVVAEPKPRRFHVTDLGSFALAVSRYGTDKRSAVFVSGMNLLCELDTDGARRESFQMELVTSGAMNWLCNCPTAESHQGMLRILKVAFKDGVEPADVAALKRVRLSARTESQSSVEHDRSTMGHSVEREAAAVDGSLPEFIDLKFRVYSNVPELPTATVSCYLDIDLNDGTMTLHPNQEQLIAAKYAAQVWLKTELDAKLEELGVSNAVVFLGQKG